MILGLGSDICDIRRIEAVIARHGERFLARIFTATERARAARRTERIQAATFAKRFAAKEAAAKALGTGFRRGVFFSDLGVVNLTSGQPTLRMTGGPACGDHARRNGGRRRIDDDRRIPIRLRPGDHFGYGGEVGGCGSCDTLLRH
jgi:holo-[acyl-carrier protein] synthase